MNALKLQHLCQLVMAPSEEVKPLWESSLTFPKEKAMFENNLLEVVYTQERLATQDDEVKKLKDEAEEKRDRRAAG